MRVFPDAQVVHGYPPLGRYGGGFGNNKSCPAYGTAAQVYQMPVVGKSVCRRIFTHGRYHDAVTEGDIFKSDGAEQFCHSYWVVLVLCTTAKEPKGLEIAFRTFAVLL